MPRENWDVLSIRETAADALRRVRDDLRSAGTGSLPPDLAAAAGTLSLSDVVMLGAIALRSRMRGAGKGKRP
jgi:hypothetical protein